MCKYDNFFGVRLQLPFFLFSTFPIPVRFHSILFSNFRCDYESTRKAKDNAGFHPRILSYPYAWRQHENHWKMR